MNEKPTVIFTGKLDPLAGATAVGPAIGSWQPFGLTESGVSFYCARCKQTSMYPPRYTGELKCLSCAEAVVPPHLMTTDVRQQIDIRAHGEAELREMPLPAIHRWCRDNCANYAEAARCCGRPEPQTCAECGQLHPGGMRHGEYLRELYDTKTIAETAYQPPPQRNELPAVQDIVVADIETRKRQGIEKYGTALQPHNGRDALVDAYQEALDLVMYLRQAIYERDGK